MKTIRRAFVLLLAVLMLIGMALPACAEELALDAEPIVEDSEPETTPEPEVTPEPTATPDPVPADAATPLALESEGEEIFLTTKYPSMLQGDAIRLTDDLDLSSKTVKFDTDEITILDLNGHTLTVGFLVLDNYVTVMLTDSVGTGCIRGPIKVEPNSTLVLNGGTVTSTTSSTLGGTIITGKGTTVFNGPVQIIANTTVSGGVFNGDVDNNGTIAGGVFNGTVKNNQIISGGTFNGSVTSVYSASQISGGVFNGDVSTIGSISGGVFYGNVKNNELLSISGGVFCGDVPTDKLPTDKSIYTVTFDPNGGTGSIPNQVVVGSSSATAIKPATDPTRDGYAFLGWYNDKNQLYDFSKPVTENVSLIALWTPVYYGITYRNETPGEDAPKYYAYDSYTALPKSTKPGYTLRWFESNDFTGDPVTAIKASVYGNKTFYGQMVANNYTVTYDIGESITAPESQNKTWPDKLLDGVDKPSKSGYTFGGWKCGNVVVGPDMTVAGLAEALGEDDSIESLTLTATWIPDGNTGGGDDKPTGGGDDKPTGDGDDKPTGGGDDKPTGGSDDKPTGGGDDKPTGGGDDKPTGGGDDKPTGGGDDKSTGDKAPGGADGNSAKAPSSASKPPIPKTGDDGMIVLWLALAAASALALGYATLRKKEN